MKTLRAALMSFVILTLITGIAYPLAVTGLAQGIFPTQANGSLVKTPGKIVGSSLIGQEFSSPRYFWGRPSATASSPYNAMASGGSNLGPSNPALLAAVQERMATLKKYAVPPGPVPADLVTASASGLDPHISPAAARYQLPRISAQRGVAQDRLDALVAAHTEAPLAGALGEARINVLALNQALDRLAPSPARP